MNSLDKAIEKNGGPLFGIACYFYDPIVIDIAAYLGYHAIWIEMEHQHITFAQACDLCRIAQGQGLLAMIRIPDARRENVLRAAECGPDIIDLPMANSPETVQELVSHARYAPVGNRGLFGSSRAVRYGARGSIAEEQKRINEQLCLMVQIETVEASERANEICGVPGSDAIFLGPGDMSSSCGVPGQTGHPAVREALNKAIVAAKRQGKRVAMATPLADTGYWVKQGVELAFFATDVSCIRLAAQQFIDNVRAQVSDS